MFNTQASIADMLTRFFVYCGTWPSWVGHVLTLFCVFGALLVIHDLYAYIRQERGYKCRKWLPTWSTRKPYDRKDASNNCANPYDHGLTPNSSSHLHARLGIMAGKWFFLSFSSSRMVP